MKTIIVKGCRSCPFFHEEDNTGMDYDSCGHIDSPFEMYGFYEDKVHEDCPLRNEAVKIKLIEDEER